MLVDDIVDWCSSFASEDVEGVTISGGEPFQQPEALQYLVNRLRVAFTSYATRPDVLCYSGYTWAYLRRRYVELSHSMDAVITGRYVDAENPGRIWRGSANQQLIPVTVLGEERYAAFIDAPRGDESRLQVSVDEQTIWYIGIPQRGDLDRVNAALRERGVRQDDMSWRT